MAEAEITLNLGGSHLRVTAPSGDWIEKMASAFGPSLVKRTGDRQPGFTLTIEEAVVSPPTDGMPLTWEGKQTDGNYGRIHETESRLVLEVESGGVLTIDHAAHSAQAFFRPKSYSKFFGNAVMLVVDAALAASDQLLMHSACLVERRSKTAILICAPSGGGKTTTSLALAHSGFDLMTDDASIIVPNAGTPAAWGLPRALKIHRQTAKLLPWLGPLPADRWDDAGEQGVKLEQLADRIGLAPVAAVKLGAILQLGPRTAHVHRLQRIAKSELLIAIAHENVAWREAGMVPNAVAKFKSLASTVAKVPAFGLNVGTDLVSLPGLVAGVLAA